MLFYCTDHKLHWGCEISDFRLRSTNWISFFFWFRLCQLSPDKYKHQCSASLTSQKKVLNCQFVNLVNNYLNNHNSCDGVLDRVEKRWSLVANSVAKSVQEFKPKEQMLFKFSHMVIIGKCTFKQMQMSVIASAHSQGRQGWCSSCVRAVVYIRHAAVHLQSAAAHASIAPCQSCEGPHPKQFAPVYHLFQSQGQQQK